MTIQPGARFVVKKNLSIPTHGRNWTVYDRKLRVFHESFQEFSDAEALALAKERSAR